jgi:Flp pilus assembly pilin Flp
MSILRKLWNDQAGAIVTSELVLIGTILVLGMVVGLTTLRDAVTTEIGDLANAIGSVNQSYSYGGIQGHHATVVGSSWLDGVDDCDEPGGQDGDTPACMVLCNIIVPEGQ